MFFEVVHISEPKIPVKILFIPNTLSRFKSDSSIRFFNHFFTKSTFYVFTFFIRSLSYQSYTNTNQFSFPLLLPFYIPTIINFFTIFFSQLSFQTICFRLYANSKHLWYNSYTDCLCLYCLINSALPYYNLLILIISPNKRCFLCFFFTTTNFAATTRN